MGTVGTRILAGVSGLLASSYDEAHFLRDFVRFAVQDLCDWIFIHLVDRDGRILRAQAAHADTARERVLREMLGDPPLEASQRHHPVARVVATGKPMLLPGVDDLAVDGHHRGLLRRAGEGPVVLAPLRARGRVLGVMVLVSTRRPSYGADVALADVLGRMAGMGVDNARLFAGEQAARRDAERGASRLARLQAVTAALGESITPRDVAEVAVRDVVHAAGATHGAMVVARPEGDLEVLASTGDPAAGERLRPGGSTPLALALGTGAPLYAPPDGPGGPPLPACILPLLVGGRPVGALTLGFDGKDAFSLEERTFLDALARQCAHALERAQLFAAERAARAQAEASLVALRESETRYRLLADHSLDIISRLTPDGVALYVSPASRRVLGVEPEELVGRSFTARIHPEDAPRVARTPLHVLAARETFTLTYRLRRVDGTHVWIEMTGRGLRDAKGALVEVVAVSRDISERKLAEDEMEAGRRQVARSEKLSALGSLVSGVAHEVRTPLAYLTNNLFLIQTRLERAAHDPEPDLEALRDDLRRLSTEALDGADRINTLVRDLGRFTRQSSSKRAPITLDHAVGEAVRLFQATHRGQVLLESDLRATSVVNVDPVQAQQVVLNLLDNAADAVRPGGRLRVATFAEEGDAILVVEDDGPGIPPEVQTRMYDPFFTTKREGTGLGLSIVRRIVEGNGGTIECASRPGHGTTFTIRFHAAGP